MKRLLVVTVASALLFVPGVAGKPSVSSLYLGVAGDAARFKGQTGQDSAIRHVFISWDQGRTFGKKFPVLLESLRPIPMVHIGTGGPLGTKEFIKPIQIANGAGDAFLIALNEGIAAHEGLVYLRLMAEMNHFRRFHAAYRQDGTSKGPAYSPENYRKAFARMYVILHGGSAGAVNAALRQLGLPGLGGGGDLAVNPTSKLRVIWNPLGGGQPAIDGNKAVRFYPGDRYVDIVGNDLYGEQGQFAQPQNEALYAFARTHRKPYAFPEWGLIDEDYPEFVRYVCQFLRSNAGIELAAYYKAEAASRYDLGDRPKSSKTYRGCITGLGRKAP